MQEPSFSRRGSSELGIANDNEDHQITIRPRLGIADEKAPFKDTVFFEGREEECVRICPWRAQSPKIDRVISSGSPSTSVFSSELVYSSTTSHASTFSSSCMSAISSSSTNTGSYCNSNGGQMRDDEKMVNLSIAYSEVLQLQVNPDPHPSTVILTQYVAALTILISPPLLWSLLILSVSIQTSQFTIFSTQIISRHLKG